MTDFSLTWRVVDELAAAHGATAAQRLKWRQRGVSREWQIKIVETLMAAGRSVPFSDFDRLPKSAGRIAA